ncbi:MAG: SRPBCC family protein [Solirubrobacteraceae bacterium]
MSTETEASHTQVSLLATVRRSIVVEAPIGVAFKVFTEQFDRIKPREHNLLSVEIEETVFERRVGGYLYDRGVDGSECRWGRVLAYEPPHRLVISWDISPRWEVEADLERTSEVEVRFVAESEDRTRVQLEHRNLDRHGDDWPTLRDGIGGDGGWPLYLQRFADLVAQSVPTPAPGRCPAPTEG